MTKQVGWFVWSRHNGLVSCKQFSLQGYPSFPESLKTHKAHEIAKHPLTDDDMILSLGELIVKYPAPKGV